MQLQTELKFSVHFQNTQISSSLEEWLGAWMDTILEETVVELITKNHRFDNKWNNLVEMMLC